MQGVKSLAAGRSRTRPRADAGEQVLRVLPRIAAGRSRSGPVGAQGVPLTPGRSLAVDASYHSLGTPVFVAAPDLAVGRRARSAG